MITKSQRKWLRRLEKGNAWHEGPGNYLTLSFLIRQGYVTQNERGLIRITPAGSKALLETVQPKPKPVTVAANGNSILYWAYGSNLCVADMQGRCPGAKKLQAHTITDAALIFRGVADVVYREGSSVLGGLWLINRQHEEALDRYEGVRSGLYNKCYLTLLVNGEEKKALYYQMNAPGIYPPSDHYVDTVARGYRDFGLPIEALDRALQEAWANKKPTEQLVQRHARRGGNLARKLEFSE